jgi:Asp-tRNA(Asn)/Glu-tRNA(Gln) amidotransferase A subunit family amidase
VFKKPGLTGNVSQSPGLQIIAAPDREDLILSVAKVLEEMLI